MIDPKLLSTIDLAKPESRKAVQQLLAEVVRYGETREAFAAAKVLAGHLKGHADLEKSYREDLAVLKAAALPLLTREEAIAVFKDHLPAVLSRPGIDLPQLLRTKVIGMPNDEQRRFFADCVSAMEQSQAILTEKPVRMTDGSARPPTVGNWTTAIRGGLSGLGAEALLASETLTALPADDQQNVRKLLHLIDMIQKAASGESLPEDVVVRNKEGKVRVFSGGAFVPLPEHPHSEAPTPQPLQPQSAEPKPQAPPPPQREPERGKPSRQPLPRPVAPSAASLSEPKPVSQASAAPPLPKSPQEAKGMVPRQQPVNTQYSLEEEEEIAKNVERLRDLRVEPSADDVLEKKIRELAENLHLRFADENLERRFTMILTTHIKGIRNSVETQELLERPQKIGGMAYSKEEAKRILEAAKAISVKRGAHEGVKELIAEAKAHEAHGAVPKVPAVPKAKSPVPPPPPVPDAPPNPKFQPKEGVPVQQITHEQLPAQKHQHVDFSEPNAEPQKPALRRFPTRPRRPSMEDIKPTAQLAGPAEEIRSMQLADFRKLGASAKERVQKLYARFQSLGKESFALRLQGIQAWRQSGVYRLYLDLGAASMEQQKPIADVIEEREAQGQDVLSEEEFHFIADLNRQLQFT